MKNIEEKFLKTLFTSCLIIVLVKVKSKLDYAFRDADSLLYFFLFLISLLSIAIVEYLFEKLDDSTLFNKIFFRKDFIEGLWLNYAINGQTKDIYNFALLEINRDEGKYLISGRGFKVSTKDGKNFDILEDGHFHSTL